MKILQVIMAVIVMVLTSFATPSQAQTPEPYTPSELLQLLHEALPPPDAKEDVKPLAPIAPIALPSRPRPLQVYGPPYFPILIAPILPRPHLDTPGNKHTGETSWYDYPRRGAATHNHTFPRGSWIKVTDLDNGRSVTVQVIDSIAPDNPRIVDLTPGAFKEIASPRLGLGQGLVKHSSAVLVPAPKISRAPSKLRSISKTLVASKPRSDKKVRVAQRAQQTPPPRIFTGI